MKRTWLSIAGVLLMGTATSDLISAQVDWPGYTIGAQAMRVEVVTTGQIDTIAATSTRR